MPDEFLFRLFDENIHFLNTWWFYFVGPEASSVVYRLPAILAGAVAVGLAGLIARRRGEVAGLCALLLTGSSLLLVHYSSEARGYSLVVCFALLSYWLISRPLARQSVWSDVALWGAMAGGFLSQPIFVYFFAAAGLWSLAFLVRSREGWGRSIVCLLRWYLIPMLFAAWLYMVNLRRARNAGGPQDPWWQVVEETLALTVGGPDAGLGMLLVAVAVLLGFVAALVLAARRRDAAGVMWFAVVVLTPALLLAVVQRREIYPRYFVISAAFLLIALAELCDAALRRGGITRCTAIALLIASVIGNGIGIARLARLGRGSYSAAIADILAEAPSGRITLGSDFDFRNRMVLGYYVPRLDAGRRVDYIDQSKRPTQPPEWMLVHNLDRHAAPVAEYTDPANGEHYGLRNFYPYAGLSGWSWAEYRREHAL